MMVGERFQESTTVFRSVEATRHCALLANMGIFLSLVRCAKQERTSIQSQVPYNSSPPDDGLSQPL